MIMTGPNSFAKVYGVRLLNAGYSANKDDCDNGADTFER